MHSGRVSKQINNLCALMTCTDNSACVPASWREDFDGACDYWYFGGFPHGLALHARTPP